MISQDVFNELPGLGAEPLQDLEMDAGLQQEEGLKRWN
mgnify:CR=1 FL=1